MSPQAPAERTKLNMIPLTCVLPVYSGVSPAEFTRAYRSIAHQTLEPEEILVVLDGPVQPGIEEFLSEREGSQLTIIRLEHNQGVAAAMRVAFEGARHRWVARHDADDIMMPERFAIQWPIVSTGEFAAVGGAMLEFVDNPTNIVRVRRLPSSHEDLARYARMNSPLNNQSTVFDRDAVLAVGNVRDVQFMEDYDLFARLIAHGYRLHSVDKPLVLVHAQDTMYDRRTDARFAKSERQMQKNLVEMGLISRPRAVINYAIRQTFRALPRPLLKLAYVGLFHRPDALESPAAEVQRWTEVDWPGFRPEPDWDKAADE